MHTLPNQCLFNSQTYNFFGKANIIIRKSFLSGGKTIKYTRYIQSMTYVNSIATSCSMNWFMLIFVLYT